VISGDNCSSHSRNRSASKTRCLSRHSPRPLFFGASGICMTRGASHSEIVCRHCEERSDEAIHSFFLCAARWIASRSLSSGAHSRDPLARNDGFRTNAPHSQPSSPAKAGDPVFRDVSDGTGRPRRTGYPAGACHRARRRRDPVAGMTALRGATHPPPPHQRRSVNLGLIPANYDADTTPPPPVNGSNS
jgi:hypothetical protein